MHVSLTWVRTHLAFRVVRAYVRASSSSWSSCVTTSICTSFQGEERLPEKHVIPIVDVDKWTWRQTSCMSPQKGKAFALHVHCTCKCPLCTACPRYLLRVAFVCWLSGKKHSRTYVRTYSPRTALAEEPELWLLVQAFTARSHALTHAHRLTVARKAEVVGAAVLQCRGCFKRPPE